MAGSQDHTQLNRDVRVFISSTFRDMHAERDHLVTVVFPELRERLERLGLEFFDVDLRWGVPAKGADGETANSWAYCKQWIDRVEPFFLCMLGQRYGWTPSPEQLRDEQDRALWAGRSVTEMEIRHAVLSQRRRRRSFFYLRQTLVPPPPQTPSDVYNDFVDIDSVAQGHLSELKREIGLSDRPLRNYEGSWTGNGFENVEVFGQLVLEDLWSGVLRDERYVSKEIWRQVLDTDPDADSRYTDESQPVSRDLWERIVSLAKPQPKEPLDAEREQMDSFAASRLRWFQGRTRELQQLTDFLHAGGVNAPRLAVVEAIPGQGKSALLACLHEQLKSSSDFVITHFVGATERSMSAHALVERLLDELDRSGIAWPVEEQREGEEPKRDFNSLCFRLAQRLGNYAGERDIVILLDAINQFYDGHDLQWLPMRLGPSVSVIVSCVKDLRIEADSPEQRILHSLETRNPAPLRVSLGPLTEADVRIIVVAYLKEYCHELDREHLDTLCAITQTGNPLYLLVMLNELRTLGGNDLNRIVPELITSMPQNHPNTVSLFRWVLERLEVFGLEAARWWCLYLAHGRVGMASHELADLLARKLGTGAAATALRLERGMRRYLQHRGPQLDFFHGQVRRAVIEQYSSQVDATTVHSDIATYFHEQNSFLESLEEQRTRARRLPSSPRTANFRKVEELVYQKLNAGLIADLECLLIDVEFLEAKTEAGLVFELAADLAIARSASRNMRNRSVLRLLEQAIRRNIDFIARLPVTLFQCLWNSVKWFPSPTGETSDRLKGNTSPEQTATEKSEADLKELLQARRKVCVDLGISRPWLRSLRPPLNPMGSGLLLEMRQKHGVGALAVSPDDDVLASSDGASVNLWRLETGQHLASLPIGGKGNVSDLTFTHDGRLAVATIGGNISLWDKDSFRLLRTLPNYAGGVTALRVLPGIPVAVIGCGDGQIHLMDMNTEQLLCSLIGSPKARVTFLETAPDGRTFVSGSMDGVIRVWDASRFEMLNEIVHPQSASGMGLHSANAACYSALAARGFSQ